MARHYYWPYMEGDLEASVRLCYMCQQDKPERRREVGLLQPLPVPNQPWSSVSMDFVYGFPKINNITSVIVDINRLTKYAIFISTPTKCPAKQATTLFFHHVVKHFGVP